MGTIAEKLQYTRNAVDDIKEAIEEKGLPIDGSTPLEEYGDLIRAAITPPFYGGSINVPNNYGEPVEWVDSCVCEFENGDSFVYNSGIGYNIYFTYEEKVFSAFFGTDYENRFGHHYACSTPVKITTTGSADYAVRILNIRPLNNRQILFLWTHQLNAEATNWAPFYAQVITVKQDIDVLTTQLSSAISLLSSRAHYVEGGNTSGFRAFLDMVPLKNDVNRIVELGLLLQLDTYTSAGVKSASVLYWNDIRVTTTQLALNSTAWTTLCSVTPSADYNYLTHYRSNLYGWVYEYQTKADSPVVKLVARPDGRAVNNFVNSNISVNGELSTTYNFYGDNIAGVLSDGNVLTSDLNFSGEGSNVAYLTLYVSEYDQLKNEWNSMDIFRANTPLIKSEHRPIKDCKPILLSNNVLLEVSTGFVWHIKKTDLKTYSASYLGKFDIRNYDVLHARSYQFDGLYGNKFWGIGLEQPFLWRKPDTIYGDIENDPLWLYGSIKTGNLLMCGTKPPYQEIAEQIFYAVHGSAKHAFKVIDGKVIAKRGFICSRITVSIQMRALEYPVGIKIKICRNAKLVIGEMSKAFHSSSDYTDFTFDLDVSKLYEASFEEGDILSVIFEAVEGTGSIKALVNMTYISGWLRD